LKTDMPKYINFLAIITAIVDIVVVVEWRE
jgi:hypothetical protein